MPYSPLGDGGECLSISANRRRHFRLTTQRWPAAKTAVGFYPFTPEVKRVKTFVHG
jgi:hypothetical protein